MNERIKSLLAQAHLDVKEEYGIIDTNRVAEKFAELIVRECGKSCTLQGDEDDMFRKFGIKHFGVEQ